MHDIDRCVCCEARLRFVHRTWWENPKWVAKPPKPGYLDWYCPVTNSDHVVDRTPPKMAMTPGTKCRYCTRLIEERQGRWQREHTSKSEPGRPDWTCVKSPDRRHHPATKGANSAPKPKIPARPSQSTPKYPQSDFPPPVTSYTWNPNVEPPGYAGLQQLTQELRGLTVFTDVKGDPHAAKAHANLEMIVEPRIMSSCLMCNEEIFKCHDGKWSEKEGTHHPRVCAGPQNSLDHDPKPPPWQCKLCYSEPGFCYHWTANGVIVTIARSNTIYGRIMTPPPSCCERCWFAEDTDDQSRHCAKCPCCNCSCGCGLPSLLWTGTLVEYMQDPTVQAAILDDVALDDVARATEQVKASFFQLGKQLDSSTKAFRAVNDFLSTIDSEDK